MSIFRYPPFLYLSFGLLLLASRSALTEEPESLVPIPNPPPLPKHSETIKPEVKIIQKEKALVKEYRLNGRLYRIEVTPRIGPSYYLADIDGDGYLESHFEGPVDSDMLIPSWILFRW